MKRLTFTLWLALIVGWVTAAAAYPASAAKTLCVGSKPGCFSTIQAAVNAAKDGDTVEIASGRFAGGVTIDVSVRIVGAGANQTIISGGGPVLTIGKLGVSSEPTVSITGVTITGGYNTSFISSNAPNGGGITIVLSSTPSGAFGTGATVTITDSVITGNRVQVLQGTLPCGPGCTFGGAAGGGIDNGGMLTLNHTTVSNNTAGSDVNLKAVLSYAIGGGIQNYAEGTLTLHNSTVVGNHLSVATTGTTGPLAVGGGINSDGPLTVEASTVSGNSITDSSSNTDPSSDITSIGGGIHLTGPATVRDSLISGNSVTATGFGGFVDAIAAGGIDDDGSLQLLDSTVSNNHVSSSVTSPLVSPSVLADGGGMEVDGSLTIKDTKFSGNSASATSPAASGSGGTTAVGGALLLTPAQPVTISDSLFTDNTAHSSTSSGTNTTAQGGAIFNLNGVATITDSLISGNSAVAETKSGTVLVQGGGIANGGALTLRNSSLDHNTGVANGPSGTAQGGGIWNGDAGAGFGPPQLTLIDSAITHNTLTASPGITIHGGGLFTTFPVTLNNSLIANNLPDQCFGC